MKRLKFFLVLCLVIVLSACGTSGKEDASAKNDIAVNGSVGNSSNTETDENEEERSVVIKEDASFAGQIDGNSIEVNTESGTLALQVGGVNDVDWSSIEKDSPISIEYYKNENGQHVLTNIEVAQVGKIKAIIEEASYVGQIDSNSIEVNTEFETLALQVGGVEGVDWSSIEKNAQVIIDYYENEKGQYILQSIEVK